MPLVVDRDRHRAQPGEERAHLVGGVRHRRVEHGVARRIASDNIRGSDATTSLVPMHAITSSTVSGQPKRRSTQPTAASRKPGLPMVAGYPVPAGAAVVSASSATAGIGSTGVPTEASRMPPGTAAAVSRIGPRRSCGYGGGTKAGDADISEGMRAG